MSSINTDKINSIVNNMKDIYSQIENENITDNKYRFDSLKNTSMKLFLNLKYDEPVIIYGDYDADGIISALIMYAYLKKIKEKAGNKSKIDIIFSDRKTFFGMNENLYKKLSQKYSLILMTDNGSTEDFLTEDIDNLLIFDHHPTDNEYNYIVNPNIYTDKYSTSGGKVVFDFIKIFDENLKKNFDISLLDNKDYFNIFKELAALTLISDMANLNKHNRKFIQEALETMKECKLPIFNLLSDFNSSEIGFKIIPKINAVSRMEGKLENVVKWLLPKDINEFDFAHKYILNIDKEKKDFVLKFYSKITKQNFNENILFIDGSVIFLQENNMKSGLAGLLANKMLTEFNKPAIVIAKEGDYFVGSARGKNIKGFFNDLKKENPEFLISGGYGGHNDAMGLRTKDKKDLEYIQANINRYSHKSYFNVLSNDILTIDEYAVLKEEYNKIANNVDFDIKSSVFVKNELNRFDKKEFKDYIFYSTNNNIKFLLPKQKAQEFENTNYILIELGVGDIENTKLFLNGIDDIDYQILKSNKEENILENANILKIDDIVFENQEKLTKKDKNLKKKL